jgi:hypothetical protein
VTANPPTAAPTFGRSARIDAQLAIIYELEARYPAPTWEDVRPDWLWLYATWNAGHLFHLGGQFIAAYQGRVVHSGRDELDMRIQLSCQYQLHPEWFVISFLGDWRDGA